MIVTTSPGFNESFAIELVSHHYTDLKYNFADSTRSIRNKSLIMPKVTKTVSTKINKTTATK